MSFYTASKKLRLVLLHNTRKFLFASNNVWKYWVHILLEYVFTGSTVFTCLFESVGCMNFVTDGLSGIAFTLRKTLLGEQVKEVVFCFFFFINITLLNSLLLVCYWYEALKNSLI